MALGWLQTVFYAILALIFLSQLSALLGLLRRKTATDRGSAWALVLTWYVVLGASAVEAWLWPMPAPHYLPWLGLAAFVGGMALRIAAVRTLDTQFSPLVELQHEHRLITHGVYAWVRHPAYLGSLLWTLAVPLILESAFGMALAIAAYVPALLYRITVEEQLLAGHFADYEDYRRRVPPLVPVPRGRAPRS